MAPPGPLYEPAKRVNAEVQKFGKWLYRSQVLETFQTGTVPPDGREQPVDGVVKITGPGDLSVGRFRGEGEVYVMVANRDYKTGVTTKMNIDIGRKARVVEQLDLATNRWRPVKENKDRNGILTLEFSLEPAAATLYRWQ